MKKRIDIASVASSLRGESVFFPTKNGKPAPDQAGEPTEYKEFARLPAHQQPDKEGDQQVSNQTRLQDSIDASKHASTLAIKPDIIEIIRKIVKTTAKEEVLYVRVTKEEKTNLAIS